MPVTSTGCKRAHILLLSLLLPWQLRCACSTTTTGSQAAYLNSSATSSSSSRTISSQDSPVGYISACKWASGKPWQILVSSSLSKHPYITVDGVRLSGPCHGLGLLNLPAAPSAAVAGSAASEPQQYLVTLSSSVQQLLEGLSAAGVLHAGHEAAVHETATSASGSKAGSLSSLELHIDVHIATSASFFSDLVVDFILMQHSSTTGNTTSHCW